MTPTAPVVVIGDALIDEIRDARGVRELVGGAALNVAVGLRRLGHDAVLLAMVGSDAAGTRIRTYLADHRVPLLETPAPHGSARAIVTWSDAGEPRYEFNAASRGRGIRYPAEARAAIAAAPLVVVSCFPFDVPEEVTALREAVGAARLVVDANPRAGMMRDGAEFVRGMEAVVEGAVVKVSAEDAALLYDAGLDVATGRLLSLGAELVIATAGAAGSTLSWRGRAVWAPAADLPGPIIDTVGAGDAVTAAVTAALVSGEESDAATRQALLDRAMAIAAATCRGEGGLLRTPESLMREAPGRSGS